MKKQIIAFVLAVVVIAGLIEARGGGHGGHGGRGHGGHHGGRHGGHYGGRGYHHGGWDRGYGYGGWGGWGGYGGWRGGYWPYYATGLAIGAAATSGSSGRTYAFWNIRNHTPGQIIVTTSHGDYYLNSGETKTIDRTRNNMASINAEFNGQRISNIRLYAPNITIDNDRGSLRISQY